jgi:hypothetical protein
MTLTRSESEVRRTVEAIIVTAAMQCWLAVCAAVIVLEVLA